MTTETPALPQGQESPALPHLSGAEKAANAERINAFTELAKVTMQGIAANGNNVDAAQLLQTVQQLQICLDTLADLTLALPPQLTKEAFWLGCARRAEAMASGVRRAMLGAGMISRPNGGGRN